MAGAINRMVNLARNMGWRYVVFRSRYELLRRTGLLKKKFPTDPPYKQHLTLAQWREQETKFFFRDRESLAFARDPQPELKERADNIKAGKFLLFNSILADLGTNYDWVTNPDSGFRYDINKHWTEIADLSKEAGDIKYVWEKSRFSYLYDIIRYDYHFNDDCAALVFADILSWIKSNPINRGPNYRCSQEMSLRVLNWTFALHYYRNSPHLTDEVFDQMQHVIYWHMKHVYDNVDFSRIAVRNNHAITETLALYLTGLLFPAFPDAAKWKREGRGWFEEEITYQVYADGTYLQFSMNYHRVVVQLLTWGIVLSEKNGERFSDIVYERAKSSLSFLRTCMVDECGWLPNYGANDGALFFKLSNTHFRDYRPQLQALGAALGIDTGFSSEDVKWYGLENVRSNALVLKDGVYSFPQGGYYVVREPDTLTFIKCGSYKDRPSHADNLHIDVWYKGENILLDAGSYKYNTDEQTIRYFSGTESHNTVMLDEKDQMLKGTRFIWYYWTQSEAASLNESIDNYVFAGSVRVFRHINDNIVHRRTVIKRKGVPLWDIKDEVINAPKEMTMKQLWHLSLHLKTKVVVTANTTDRKQLTLQRKDGWHSSLYGQKEKTEEIYFCDENKKIETLIKIDQHKDNAED